LPTKYDPSIIQSFADRLYRQADQIVLLYGVAGLFLGSGIGAALGLTNPERGSAAPALFLGGAFCAVFAVVGRARSFALRLQAQTALCQAQIERNTSGGR
jgi:hypothetical protein